MVKFSAVKQFLSVLYVICFRLYIIQSAAAFVHLRKAFSKAQYSIIKMQGLL